MANEPICWAHAAGATRTRVARQYNEETGRVEAIIDEETGLPLREKVPQGCHDGSPFSNPFAPQLLPRSGAVCWLRHDGHVTPPMRLGVTGAADMDTDQKLSRRMKSKASYFGWIPAHRCPVAMKIAGEIRPQQLAAKELRKATDACPSQGWGEYRQCPHWHAEEKARKERQAAVNVKVNRAYAAEAEKAAEANKQLVADVAASAANAAAQAVASAQETKRGKRE